MTESETAEIKQEIVNLESRRDRTWREHLWLEGQIFRLRCKLNALSPEECRRISSLIGKNVTHKAWQNKEIKP